MTTKQIKIKLEIINLVKLYAECKRSQIRLGLTKNDDWYSETMEYYNKIVVDLPKSGLGTSQEEFRFCLYYPSDQLAILNKTLFNQITNI